MGSNEPIVYQVKSLVELNLFAAEIVALLQNRLKTTGTTVGLSGPLGAGKTTLVAQICRLLKCSDCVGSPSFVLENRYAFNGGEVEHWDLYRLNSPPDELELPPAAGTVRFIEWADKFAELAVTLDFHIQISRSLADELEARIITVEKF